MLPASAILDAEHARKAGYFEEKVETKASCFLDKSGISYRFFVYKEDKVEALPVGTTADPSGVVPKTRAFVDRLGINEHEIVKTLIFMDCETKKPFVILMHGDCMVNSRKLAKAVGAKRVTACPVEIAQEFSGYVVGGTSPFGLHTPMPIFMQESILTIPHIIINGGGKSHYLYMDPKDIGKALQASHAAAAGFTFALVDCKQERKSDQADKGDRDGPEGPGKAGGARSDGKERDAGDKGGNRGGKGGVNAVAPSTAAVGDAGATTKGGVQGKQTAKAHLSASAAAFPAPNTPGKTKNSGPHASQASVSPLPATKVASVNAPREGEVLPTITISLAGASATGILDTKNIPESEIPKSSKSGIPSGSNTPGTISQPRSRRTSNAHPPSQCRGKLLEEMLALFLVFPRHNMRDGDENAPFSHGFSVDDSKIDDFDLIVDDFDKLSTVHALLTAKSAADPDHLSVTTSAAPSIAREDELRALGDISLTLPLLFPLADDTTVPIRIHLAIPPTYPHDPLRARVSAAASVDLRAHIDVAGLSSGLNACAQRIATAGAEAIFAMRTYAIDHSHKFTLKASSATSGDPNATTTEEPDYENDFSLSMLNRVRNRVPPHDGFVGVSSPASLVDVKGGELIPLLGKPRGHIKIGLVGLPNVGKSSLFNLLSGMRVPAENYPFCTIDPNVATIPVADHRYRDLLAAYKPAKHSPAVVSVVDIAGLVKGASKGRGLGNVFLHHISTVQVVYQVIRVFDDTHVVHVEGHIDPLRDIQVINRELLEKDMEQMHVRIKRLNRPKFQQWAPALARKENEELAVLLKAHEWLLQGQPLRLCRWTPQEAAYLSTLQMWTSKPVCYLLNMSAQQYACEQQREKAAAVVKAWVHTYAPDCGVACVSVTYEEAKLHCGEDAEPWMIVAVANKLLERHKRAELEAAEREKLREELELAQAGKKEKKHGQDTDKSKKEKEKEKEKEKDKKKEKKEKEKDNKATHSSHSSQASQHGKEGKEQEKKDKKDKKTSMPSFGGDLGLGGDLAFGFDSFLHDAADLVTAAPAATTSSTNARVNSTGHGDKKEKKDKHSTSHDAHTSHSKATHHNSDKMKDKHAQDKPHTHSQSHTHVAEPESVSASAPKGKVKDDEDELDPELHRDVALSGRPVSAPAIVCHCSVCEPLRNMDAATVQRVTDLAFHGGKSTAGDGTDDAQDSLAQDDEEEEDKGKGDAEEVEIEASAEIKGAKGRLLWLREDSALGNMLRMGYGMARLRQVFIAYPQLVKGFMVPWACKAPQAAARVHYDLANTFVSCEVCAFEDWKKHKRSMNEARENGCVKTQGKNYEVRDGDILMFKGLNKNKLGL